MSACLGFTIIKMVLIYWQPASLPRAVIFAVFWDHILAVYFGRWEPMKRNQSSEDLSSSYSIERGKRGEIIAIKFLNLHALIEKYSAVGSFNSSLGTSYVTFVVYKACRRIKQIISSQWRTQIGYSYKIYEGNFVAFIWNLQFIFKLT